MTTVATVDYGMTANERLKRGFSARVGLSLMLATFLHLLPFRFWPGVVVEDWSTLSADVPEVVQLPPTALPSRPATIHRPARPVFSTEVTVSQTMPVVDWAEARVLPPPPPPAAAGSGASTVPFTPFTAAPTLQNPEEVERSLRREYPGALRDAGIGGTVNMLVHLASSGAVMETRVRGTSGYSALDAAALRVAAVMRFRPAMNRDVRVAVWITLPVTFQVR